MLNPLSSNTCYLRRFGIWIVFGSYFVLKMGQRVWARSGVSAVPCINYWPIASKFTSYLVHVWKMWAIKFQENPENGSLGAAEHVLVLQVKRLLFLTNCNKAVSFVTHPWRVRHVTLRLNSSNGSRYTAEKLLRPPCLNYWPIATKLNCS